eukprot:7409381-Ditylum_brightwellii.AAC.1
MMSWTIGDSCSGQSHHAPHTCWRYAPPQQHGTVAMMLLAPVWAAPSSCPMAPLPLAPPPPQPIHCPT